MSKIEYYDVSDKNVFVVGDIHGCYDKLIDKLNSIGFDFQNDLLFSVGDSVDRGPQKEKWISLLNEKWFLSVRGNHEEFCIRGADNYEIEFYHKMTNNGGDWFYKYETDERLKIAKKFEKLPYMIELKYNNKKFGFVHADLPIDDWDVVKIMLENNDEWEGRDIKDHITWGRNLVYRDQANIANIDYVFLGHTVLNTPKAVGNAIFIDTGAVFGNGRELTIVNLKDMK